MASRERPAAGTLLRAATSLPGAAILLCVLVPAAPGAVAGVPSPHRVVARAPAAAEDALATLRVLFPNGGDTLSLGESVVRWSSSSDILSVDVLLSRTGPGGPYEYLDRIPFNTGFTQVSYSLPTTDAYVRIVGYTATGDSAVDLSDAAFRIVPAAGPTMLRYTARAVDEGVLLRWHFASRATLVSEWLERSRQPEGAWEALHPLWSMDADTTVALDTLAVAGESYAYRVASYHNDATIWSFAPYFVDIPAARLAVFDLSAFDDAVEVRWRFTPPPAVLRVALERSTEPFADWETAPGTTRIEGDDTVFLDTFTTPGERYAYRLAVRVPGGAQTFAAGFVTAAPPLTAPTLSPARPNPAADAVHFDIELPADAEVRLRVFDIQGRQVARVHDGPLHRGRHTLTWAGAGDPDVLPGVYIVEFTTPRGTLHRRVVVAPLR